MGVPYAEVIGDPIEHSKSPLIHQFWLGKLGIEGDYRAVRVPGEGLADYLETRRVDPDWRGCSVTMPLKREAVGLMDRLDGEAAAIGALNLIRPDQGRLEGHNTDATGFMEPLRRLAADSPPPGAAAVLVGAGGAARAAAFSLWSAGYGLRIANRSRDHARALADSVAGIPSSDIDTPAMVQLRDLVLGPPRHQPSGLSLLVNATPLGMRGQPPLDVSLATVPNDLIVYDLVYDPIETPLLRQARERGLRTIDGLAMLIGQARGAFGLFFGADPGYDHDVELRERLTR
jgi:shikimate dehydrogenase